MLSLDACARQQTRLCHVGLGDNALQMGGCNAAKGPAVGHGGSTLAGHKATPLATQQGTIKNATSSRKPPTYPRNICSSLRALSWSGLLPDPSHGGSVGGPSWNDQLVSHRIHHLVNRMTGGKKTYRIGANQAHSMIHNIMLLQGV
jgi:hypothetical protein